MLRTMRGVALLSLSVASLGFGTVTPVAAGFLKPNPLGVQLSAGSNGTTVLRGSLPSTVTLTTRGQFSVGHVTNFTWDLSRLTNTVLNGYSERVLSQRYHFNIRPDSWQDLTVDGMAVRRFFWSRPPVGTTITVTVRRTLQIQSPLTRFRSRAPFPLQHVPASVQSYLQVTSSLHLSAAQRSFVRHLVRHRTTERSVVRKVANWIASHVRYDASLIGGPFAASWVLRHRRATCQGYASLMAGMLRVLHIPSQVVYGWVAGAPIRIPTARGARSIQWTPSGSGATLHDWLNVYFPHTGWVAFDPQIEKFFVDSRHYAVLAEVDASVPSMGQWTANTVAGEAPTGQRLANGGDEIVPDDGFYPLGLTIHDSFRFHVASVLRDVHRVALYSR